MDFELKTLIDKLNPVCRKGLEQAAALCVSQTNYNIEIEHLLLRLVEMPGNDIDLVLRRFDLTVSDVVRELTRSIDGLKRGNSQTPVFSPHIPRLLQEAWLISSLTLGTPQVRSGAVLLALLDNTGFRGIVADASPKLASIPRDVLRTEMPGIIASSGEQSNPGSSDRGTETNSTGTQTRGGAATEALDLYTTDLTELARSGAIDPILGRDAEIRQIVDILMRRRQNNPILTGEAGVGKTAVVEGFALRIVSGDVPPPLRDVSIRVLDLGLLQAGAGVKGEFENRLKSVINEVKGSPRPIILFIDEAHTMIGAGGTAGQGDAANLLKPALARGELRTIAATTWSEYKKYFEKDPALTRRFQVVKVEEPDEDRAITMLRGIAANYERHHNVHILDEAVREAVRLSHRYISGRQLPDKGVSVLDTACARVAIGQNATPSQIVDINSRIARLELELEVLEREQVSTRGHAARIIELKNSLEKCATELAELEGRWRQELEIVVKINALRLDVEAAAVDDTRHDEVEELVAQLDFLRDSLEAIQAGNPMVHASVTPEVVAAVISGWTGIPIGKMVSDEIRSVLTLENRMAERIVGQQNALNAISRRIRTSRADLVDPEKPVGVFLLVGPSGVGKTETAVTLAELLYGGERNMVTINMSEYQEAHTVSALKGSPPGYVGYGQGGVLTEAVRRNPYSVVLLDEVEKAHPDVMELFYQVFDKGRLEDGEGVEIDFKNTVILLTSNIATDTIMSLCGKDKSPNTEELVEAIRPQLLKHFKAALLGRMSIVPFYPLGQEQIRGIVGLKLEKIRRRFSENHRAEMTIDDALITTIAERCTETDSGARNIDHILTQTLLPDLSSMVLERIASEHPFWSVRIGLDAQKNFEYRFTPPIPGTPSDNSPDEPLRSSTGVASGDDTGIGEMEQTA